MASRDVEILKEAGRARLRSLKRRCERKENERDALKEKVDGESSKKKQKRRQEELTEVEASVKR
jgi:hypothetical protein